MPLFCERGPCKNYVECSSQQLAFQVCSRLALGGSSEPPLSTGLDKLDGTAEQV